MSEELDFDTLGDKCKAAEDNETLRAASADQVMIVRLDGHGFSKFTKGLARPYDGRLSSLMIDAVTFVISKTGAIVGYTQSDEITLVFIADGTTEKTHYFGGRLQKVATTCAAYVTAYFNTHLATYLPEKAGTYPCFDGRAWAVDTIKEAYENLLWRERDATKNSITMAASTMFSHKSLQGVNGTDKKQMMLEKGVDWNNYPAFFTRGTYVKRVTIMKTLTEQELEKIPLDKRPAGPVARGVILSLDMPPINKLQVFGAVLFEKNPNRQVTLRDGVDHFLF